MNVRLIQMTKPLCRQYYMEFELDPILFMDTDKFKPYEFSEEKCDALVERYRNMGRTYMVIMLGDEPIGEVILKNIDWDQRCGTLSIHMKNDRFKNKGYGTQAEILMLQYGFHEMGLDTIYADALKKNLRSRHVLEKVGFQETRQDMDFVYYQCCKSTWKAPER